MAERTPKKRGRGRPAKDPENPRNMRIQILVSQAELDRLNELRGEESVGGLVYSWIRHKLQSPKK